MFLRKCKTLLRLIRNLERIPYLENQLDKRLHNDATQVELVSTPLLQHTMDVVRVEQAAFEKSMSMMIEDFRREIFIFLGSNDSVNLRGAYSLRTDFPVAINSDDHIFPCGTMRDNTRHPRFVRAIEIIFGKKISTLDLGCAGGGLVMDFLLAGNDSMGIEGSDYSERWVRAEWGTIPHRLFTADITKPFNIYNHAKPAKFELITAWEVLEHIPENEIPNLFQNIRNHLAFGGLFVGSVATFPHEDPVTGAVWHVTVKPKEWWHSVAVASGFDIVEGLFEVEDFPRGSGNPRRSDWSAKEDPSLGFHLCLRLRSASVESSSIESQIDLRASIISGFHSIYGHERLDNYSKSLSEEGFQFFESVINKMSGRGHVRYLEIGSFEGVSMVVVGSLLKKYGHMTSLTSIDPYSDNGYWEGNPILGKMFKIADKTIKNSAFDFYSMSGLTVVHIEDVSRDALIELLRQHKTYDLIYIDGHHEKLSPLEDIALSLQLLEEDGVIIVDDWIWPDVAPIKNLLDLHLVKIEEHPLMAAYKKNTIS